MINRSLNLIHSLHPNYFLGWILSIFAKYFLIEEIKSLKLEIATVSKKVDYENISPKLVEALIQAEDKRFYRHHGIDFISILRASYVCVSKKGLQGASTIEQQLVRTLTQRYELTLKRKLREMLLASCLPMFFPKCKIPFLYLNIAYFGWNMQGIEQACKRLSVNPACLTNEQAAFIVACLKYPLPSSENTTIKHKLQNRKTHILKLLSNKKESICAAIYMLRAEPAAKKTVS